MRRITRDQIASAILATALILPVAAWAASDTPPATAPAATSGATAAPAPGGRQEKVEQRIADMHATLHITDAQAPAWDSFAQVMLDNAQAMDTALGKNAASAPPSTATAIMQSYAEIAELHAQNVQKLSTAFDKLYAALTTDQQKTADEMFRAKADAHEQKQGG